MSYPFRPILQLIFYNICYMFNLEKLVISSLPFMKQIDKWLSSFTDNEQYTLLIY